MNPARIDTGEPLLPVEIAGVRTGLLLTRGGQTQEGLSGGLDGGQRSLEGLSKKGNKLRRTPQTLHKCFPSRHLNRGLIRHLVGRLARPLGEAPRLGVVDLLGRVSLVLHDLHQRLDGRRLRRHDKTVSIVLKKVSPQDSYGRSCCRRVVSEGGGSPHLLGLGGPEEEADGQKQTAAAQHFLTGF